MTSLLVLNCVVILIIVVVGNSSAFVFPLFMQFSHCGCYLVCACVKDKQSVLSVSLSTV